MSDRRALAGLLFALVSATGCKFEASTNTGLPDSKQAGGAGGSGQAGSGQAGSGAAGQSGAGGSDAGAGGTTAGAGGSDAGAAGSGQSGQGGTAGAGGSAGTGGSGGGKTLDPVPALDGALAVSASCSDLEAKLKKDASARMNARLDAELAYFSAEANPGAGGAAGAAGSAGSAGAAGGIQQEGGPDDSFATKYDYSKTNLQVQGVDEADIVKADAEFIYVLHGSVFGIVDVDPPEQMQFLNSIEIEGYPVEMFVSDGHAIVYSLVNGKPIYDAAGVTPKPRLQGDSYGWGNYEQPADLDPNTLLTKVTVLDMPEASIKVTGELYFEGAYLSARRVGDSVRTVIRGGAHGPTLNHSPDDYTKAGYDKLRQENQAKIDASTASDWLPYRFSKVSGKVTATEAPCEEFYVPSAGSSEFGLVQLQEFDWTKPTEVRGASVVADSNVVYGSAGAVYVAATATDDIYQSYYYSSELPPAGTVQSLSHTYLHRFDFPTGQAPRYTSTGTVNGRVINQFALDEFNGDLRVAVIDDRVRWEDYGGGDVYPTPLVNSHVFVLREDAAEKKLNEVGAVRDLKENEQLRSVRFVDGRGYVVTFEQIDPLFVLDLSKPEAPTVLGQLEIPGFATYMHPLGANHLLTIGKETEGESGSVHITGLKLQIFDVTDGTKPSLVQAYTYKADGALYSEAENNHKAFSYHPDKKILTFPLSASGYDTDYTVHSTLEVFSVDTSTGFSPLAAITHDDLFKGSTLKYCINEDFPAIMRRGVFLGDVLYSVSYAGIKANRLSDLGTVVSSMPLQTPSAFNFQCAPP